MYGESRHALREYIQNAFDGIQRARQASVLDRNDGHISIKLDAAGDSISIRDNGIGLPNRSAADTLVSIGASGKNYQREAGFRGIGRLAGIVFCDTLVFRTKSAGDDAVVTVVYDARGMRDAMKPGSASAMSAERMITSFVTATRGAARDIGEHFFEVTLQGFQDAPEECTSIPKLRDYLSQIAPVAYDSNIPSKLRTVLEEGQVREKSEIETVKISIVDPHSEIEVFKPYQSVYRVGRESTESGEIEETAQAVLSEIHLEHGTDWWGWWGDKDQPGQYSDARVSGIRIRVKNIQIDGTEVFREIFKRKKPSYIRFQDWFVGEIFVRADALVPNARRDGFEENAAWKAVRSQWTVLAGKLAMRAYEISDKNQTNLVELEKDAESARNALDSLRRENFQNETRTIELAAAVTKIQKKIAKATKGAGPRALPSLQALASEVVDIRVEAVTHLAGAALKVDGDARDKFRKELLLEIQALVDAELENPCASRVSALLERHFPS